MPRETTFRKTSRCWLIAILLLLFPAFAHADWQNTLWGMSVSQIIHLYVTQGLRVVTESEQKARTFDENLAPMLVLPYSTGPFEFEASFFFLKQTGGLQCVNLDLKNPALLKRLDAELSDKYGKEIEGANKQTGSLKMKTWVTTRDKIMLFFEPNKTVTLLYCKRSSAGL